MSDRSPDGQYSGRYSILAAIMLGSIMGPIDASIVNVTLPTIAEYFGVKLSAAQWVPMSYLLVISSLLLFYGRLGDILGYKRVYLTGLAGFVSASALCGLSYFLPTIHWLIGFRAMQGLAAGMMMAMPYAIITASFPPTERGRSLRSVSVTAKGTYNLAGKLAQANHPVEQLRNQLNKIGRGGGVRLSPVSITNSTLCTFRYIVFLILK
jgi:MFS family permease